MGDREPGSGRPPAVAFIISGLGVGGAEMALLRLLEHSPRLRAGMVVSLGGGGEIASRIADLGVRVEVLNLHWRPLDFRGLRRLLALLRSSGCRVVSTWLYLGDLVGGVAGRYLGIPVVWGVRSSELPASSTKLATRVLVRLCALLSHWIPAMIVSNSTRGRDAHLKLGYPAHKFAVIENGFDLGAFRPDPANRGSFRRDVGLAEDSIAIGMIARFDRHKNHRGFLQAAAIVAERFPTARFILAGAGVDAENPAINGWLATHSLADRVLLLGRRSDVPRLMAALDLVVSASWTESFPNVIAEAMACGVPCVVTDVGESAVIVADSGVVVPPGQPGLLAAGIIRILSMNPGELGKLSLKARQRIVSHYDIARTAERFERLFASVEGE